MASRHYLKYTNGTPKDEIKSIFGSENWVVGKTYSIKITNIYDPTKIWIVTKHKELDMFHKSLFKFYNANYTSLSVPPEKIIKNLSCVVYTDEAFYRGLVKQIIYTTSGKRKIQVLLMDFGYLATVTQEDIFELKPDMASVSKFCIRASLSDVKPKSDWWGVNVVEKLHELISGKLTAAIIRSVDYINQILYVKVGIYEENDCKIEDLGSKLIQEGLAERLGKSGIEYSRISKYTVDVRRPYLFPSHEALEDGRAPNSLRMSENLKDFVPLDKLYPNYFKFNG